MHQEAETNPCCVNSKKIIYVYCKQRQINCDHGRLCALCMPQVPFAFEFESERPNGNSATKQLPNYHSAVSEKSVTDFIQI